MGIVNRPIQRVHVPLVSLAAGHQADFLGNDPVSGKEPLDLAEQECLRLAVHFGDEVNHILIVHLVFVLVSEAQKFTGLASQPFEVR